jgi:hypothetical protein
MSDSVMSWLLGLIGNSLFVMGLFLILVSVFLKDKASATSPKFKPAKIAKITFDPLPSWAFRTLLIAGIVFAITGLVQTLWLSTLGRALGTNNGDDFVGVNLASVTFETGGWNPRVIDLRTSNAMGIHAAPGVSLELHDLQAFAPESLGGGYFVQAKVFVNETVYLGKTEAVTLVPGAVVSLGMVKPESFQDPNLENAWAVDDKWEKLLFKLEILAKKDGDPLAAINYYVQLSDNTDSWYIYPPYGDIASIVYSVNDGPDLILDLRSATTEGIDVQNGDTLKLKEIWAKSLVDSDKQLAHAEAYPSSGVYDGVSLIKSDGKVFKTGLFNLVTDNRFQWTIAQDKTSIVVTLSREDSTLLDRYIIPFKVGQSASVLRADKVIAWPQNVITYLDFENPVSIETWSEGWGDGSLASFAITDQEYFSGSHSVAVTVTDDGEKTFIMYNQPIKANYIIGQVFWPKQDGISVSWSTISLGQTGDAVKIPSEMGQWNTFVFDLSRPAEDGTPQNQIDIPNFYIQGSILGASSSNPYTFYIDGIQIYPVVNP